MGRRGTSDDGSGWCMGHGRGQLAADEGGRSRVSDPHQQWLDQQAIERLAQHIPFETDLATKSELIEMLRGLVLRVGRTIPRESFGFEAEQELRRLGLWDRLGGQTSEGAQH